MHLCLTYFDQLIYRCTHMFSSYVFNKFTTYSMFVKLIDFYYHSLLLCLVIWILPKFHACTHESQVPVASGRESYPFSLDVSRNTRFLFTNRTSTPAKTISKSIVRKYVVTYFFGTLTLEPSCWYFFFLLIVLYLKGIYT